MCNNAWVPTSKWRGRVRFQHAEVFLLLNTREMLSCTISYVNDMGHYVPKTSLISGDPLSEGIMRAAWELTESNVYTWVENGAICYAPSVPSRRTHINVNGTDVDLTVRWPGPLKEPDTKGTLLRDIRAQQSGVDWADQHRKFHGDWMRATSNEEPLIFP